MKNNKILYIAAFATLFGLGCSKDFDKINDDPNNPSNVPTAFLLSGAQKGIADNTVDRWWGGSVGNQLAQYWSSNQYTSESRYQFRTNITNTYWNLFYAGGANATAGNAQGGLVELQKIIDLCTTEPDKYSTSGYPKNQIAVAKLLQSLVFQNLTDTWGSIPYSEAAKGVANTSPKYDNQKDIYIGILASIDSALAMIDDAKDGPSGDLLYGGDMGKWKMFGNSLKLRVAMRMADAEPTLASQKANEAVTAGIFASNADDAAYPYSASSIDGNPNWYDFNIDARNDFCGSNIMVDVLTGLGDPRIDFFYALPVDTNIHIGEIYGLTEANGAGTDDAQVSQRSDLVMSQTFPGVLLDYAQMEFCLAEAVERGFITGNAKSHYDAGIQASMDFWSGGTISATDIATYLAKADVDYDALKAGGSTWKQIIGKQKWIALYNQGIQGWAEWRRLDFGILQLPADGVLDGTGIPNRLLYPTDEQRLNGTNYKAALSSQGPDVLSTKLWWDKN
jgi:hypothetical protein